MTRSPRVRVKEVRYKAREISATLTCAHVLTFPAPLPEVGSVIWCRKCDGTRMIVSREYTGRMWAT